MPSIRLEDYHISESTGFALDEPLESLSTYFQPWESIASEFPELLANHTLRDEVNKMPLLDHSKLIRYSEKRLAHLQLSLIGAAYVWQEGDKGVVQHIPCNLAIPWNAVSKDLGFPPILCHPSFALANWRRVDKQEPLCLDNITCIYEMPGRAATVAFITVTVLVEFKAVTVLKGIVAGLSCMDEGEEQGLTEALRSVTQGAQDMKEAFTIMHKRLDADLFYSQIRPLLQGWGGSSSPLPDGLVYEGVSELPKQCIGGSAAQSSSFQSIDAFLGVKHDHDKQEFMSKMKNYMPPPHKDFINEVEQRTRLPEIAMDSDNKALKEAYNSCVQAVRDFRSYHIQAVTKYIIVMANKKAKESQNFQAVAKRGTGGSSVLPFLRSIRSSTEKSFINK